MPSDLKKEVADFVEFLLQKGKTKKKIKQRKFGYAKGFFKMSADFNEPLDQKQKRPDFHRDAFVNTNYKIKATLKKVYQSS